MIVRALDSNGDWTFGKGQEDYLSGNAAMAQLIKTNLQMFLGDCFFATNTGIDWFNLLAPSQQLNLQLQISTLILNTENVTGILQLSVNLSSARVLTVQYQVMTAFSNVNDQFIYDFGLAG